MTSLIINTSLRRQVEGLFIALLGITLLVYWFFLSCPMTFIGVSLLVMAILVSLVGLNQTLSFQTCKFEKDSKIVKQIILYFGFFKKYSQYEVQNITIFTDEITSFSWAIFAYEEDIDPRQVLPQKRFMIAKSISYKKAKKLCEEIDQLCPINYRKYK